MKILYKRQFGFREGHWREHATCQLTDQIKHSFEKHHFTPGIFIDLLKTFDTVVDHILSKKLNQYRVKGSNIRFFKSYFSNCKQYISFNNKCSTFKNITCGVPQGFILGPLLFLIYLNDLPNVSKLLDPIMFADETNLFFSHHDIKTLFHTVNNALWKTRQWLIAKRLL